MQNAVNAMTEKNKQLRDIIASYQNRGPEDVSLDKLTRYTLALRTHFRFPSSSLPFLFIHIIFIHNPHSLPILPSHSLPILPSHSLPILSPLLSSPLLANVYFASHDLFKPSAAVGIRSLNGVIDAEVNGGIRMYQEAFFVPEYVRENPDNTPHLHLLLSELEATLPLLEEGLMWHRRLVQENMLPLHEKMERFFLSMKERVRSMAVPNP